MLITPTRSKFENSLPSPHCLILRVAPQPFHLTEISELSFSLSHQCQSATLELVKDHGYSGNRLLGNRHLGNHHLGDCTGHESCSPREVELKAGEVDQDIVYQECSL